MADPLSIGFGVVGVVGLAMQVAQFVTQFGLDWKDAPTEVKAFREELLVLAQTLSVTNTIILRNPDFAAAFENHSSVLLSQLGPNPPNDTDVKTMLQSCERRLQDLLRDLQKRAKGHRVGWDRLKAAFLVKQTRETVENLHRQCLALNSMVMVDAVALGATTHTKVKAIQEDQRDGRREQHDAIKASQRWREEERAQKILYWLSPADYGTQQSDFFHRRQDGTGQWLLDSNEYRNWQSNSAATLYCDGMPGAGKTMMTSIVVNHLHGEFGHDRGTGIAYLYCNFRQQEEQKPANLLASVLKQLVLQRPNMPAGVEGLYEHHHAKQTRPSLRELVTELHSIASVYSKSFIVVDALDECSISGGGRHDFMSELLNLQTRARSNVFVTSRINPQIAREIGPGCTRIEIRASDADVRKYLQSQVHRLPTFIQNSTTIQEEIMQGISALVKGMFLLARLHLESLTTVRSVKALRTRLVSLPKGSNAYDQSYTEAMQRIHGQNFDAQDLALQTLAWISSAKRPLSTTEIQHALAVEQDSHVLDEDNLSEVEDILSVCAGLVVVDEDSQIIRLVHYTTQEFFEREWVTWFPRAQFDITRTCVTYLLFDVFESGFCHSDDAFEQRLRLNPLYDYAARHWGSHALTVTGDLLPLLLDLFLNKGKLAGCSQALILSTSPYRYPNYSQTSCDWTSFHVAAYFGLGPLIEILCQKGLLPDLKDSVGRTPLWWAAEEGHEAVVRLLVERDDVEADSKDKYGQTPLLRAAQAGHEAVVRLLVERDDVKADSQDKYSQTPLLRAAEQGHEAVVRLLVERDNVEADSQDKYGRTPLSQAAETGHEAVVQLLVERDDVEADSQDKYSQTPLWWAAERGHEAVVRLLVERDDVEADSQDKYGRTPLLRAAEQGHEAVVRLLVERDDVRADSQDNNSQTPLLRAAQRGHEAIVQLLVERDDVKADSQDKYSRTPLWWAAERGHEAVVRLLVERDDVEADSQDKYGRTPLLRAAEQGHEAVVRLLVERDDVRADSQDNNSQTPLWWAAAMGHESVVQLLVERDDVEADSQDKYGRTPLSIAAAIGYESVVQLLVERDDVKADSKDSDGWTPLLRAARQGHEAIVRRLVEWDNIKVDSKDNDGRTPLSQAAEHGHEAVVQLLVRRDDVEADSKDKNGQTPLSWAAEQGHEAVVQLLVGRDDVEADSKDERGRTPLWHAAQRGHEAVVKLLVKNARVDAGAQDDSGLTPFQIALFNGNEVVESLLAMQGGAMVDDAYGLSALFVP